MIFNCFIGGRSIRRWSLYGQKTPLEKIEAPRCKQRGMFCLAAVLCSTVRNWALFSIRSLTPQQAAGNALAFAVQAEKLSAVLVARDCLNSGS
jgi:hypothetical protein